MPSASDDDSAFFEPRLRFGIRRPPGWRFDAAAWSPAAQPAPLLALDWRRFSRLPFVALSREVGSRRHPRPTLSVRCRPVGRHRPEEIRALLARQAEAIRADFAEVELLETSYDAILGGCRAAHVRFRYSQTIRCATGAWPARVLARSYLLLGPGIAYLVGMSADADPRFGVPEQFAAALASIRVGRPLEELAGAGRGGAGAGPVSAPAPDRRPAGDGGGCAR